MNLVPSSTTFLNTKNKIFIVSLPRTGTKSMCKMFSILGYSIYHCPSIRLESYLTSNQFEVFADTPIYCPSVFEIFCKESSNKFIYIDRNVDKWIDSFERMDLHKAYLDYLSRDYNAMRPISKLDTQCLKEIFEESNYSSGLANRKYFEHKEKVFNIIPKEQLLIYNFEEGWNTLCTFLGKNVPSIDIPLINKNTLFEKIN